MKIEKGDKVKTPNGRQGEVIDCVYDMPLSGLFDNPRMKVRLDGSREEKIFYQDELILLGKKPNLQQAFDALNNIKQQIILNNIHNLQKRENDELHTHLGYFEEYVREKNQLKKDLAISNLNYVEQILENLKSTNSSASVWVIIKDNLEKIRWWTRYN